MTLRAQLLGRLAPRAPERVSLCALVMKQDLDHAAHDAATSPLNLRTQPTEGQRASGNYRKGHVSFAGLRIAIENPAGSRRRSEWPEMLAHYGYVKGTEGKDGDAVDCFLRPSTSLDWDGDAYVVDQYKQDGTFDEHKIMLGWDDEESATKAYLAHYPSGWKLGPVTVLSLDGLKTWLTSGNTKQPLQGEAQ